MNRRERRRRKHLESVVFGIRTCQEKHDMCYSIPHIISNIKYFTLKNYCGCIPWIDYKAYTL
jgi:hypothetical protein